MSDVDGLREVVYGWLMRHPEPAGAFANLDVRGKWLDWAADNFLVTPEVRAALDSYANQRAAEELRAIVLDALIVAEVMHSQGPIRVPVSYLDERAAALADDGQP